MSPVWVVVLAGVAVWLAGAALVCASQFRPVCWGVSRLSAMGVAAMVLGAGIAVVTVFLIGVILPGRMPAP